MDPAHSLRFSIFELDVRAGELRRNGSVVRLPPQPFHVLRLLVENAGSVVDREQIRREVWGETTVDFDRSLNVCVAQIRAALNDEAESPRFIQTLPRRGYRFLAEVERGSEPVVVPPRTHRRVPLLVTSGLTVMALAAASFRLGHPADQPIRIAVLPFDTVGVAPENAQIDGLFDELLTRLGGVQPDRLQVIGRRSAILFRADRKPLREIGERLKATYLVDATAKMDGERLRVAVRLSKAENDAILWTETLAQEADAAEFEERFVARVSAAVLTKLFPDATPEAAPQEACREGWDAYRTGHLLASQGTIAGLRKSLSFFEQGKCGPSQAARAQALIRLARIGPSRPEMWEQARNAAQSARDLSHLPLGNIAFWRDWDWKTAEREFHTALRVNPSDPDAHHDLAWLLVALGRREEALAALQRALALDPLSSYINMDAAWLLLQAGRFRESAAQARRVLELDPDFKEARVCLSRALMYAGADPGATEEIRSLLRTPAGAKSAMEHYQRAWRLAWVGSGSEALEELEEAFRARSLMMPLVAVDPGFASIRKEPRFQKLVHDMGL